MKHSLQELRRAAGEMLRLTLVTVLALPALLGALHHAPARAWPDAAATQFQADLGFLCTPLGVDANTDPGKRLPWRMQAACPLCILLHGIGAALPVAAVQLQPPLQIADRAATAPGVLLTPQPRRILPPGRGPPALLA